MRGYCCSTNRFGTGAGCISGPEGNGSQEREQEISAFLRQQEQARDLLEQEQEKARLEHEQQQQEQLQEPIQKQGEQREVTNDNLFAQGGVKPQSRPSFITKFSSIQPLHLYGYVKGPQLSEGPPMQCATYRYELGTHLNRPTHPIAYNLYGPVPPEAGIGYFGSPPHWGG